MKKILLAVLVITSLNAAAQTPQLVYDIYPTNSADPCFSTVFNGKLYFAALDDDHGGELWSYDGINDPAMVYDLKPDDFTGVPPEYDQKWGVFNGKLYFGGVTGVYDAKLHSYDGVNPPVEIPVPFTTFPDEFAVIGGKLYFRGLSISYGSEVFVYDGVNAPAVVDVFPGNDASVPMDFTEIAGKAYFTANNDTAGWELFRHDPATNALSLAADIAPGADSSQPLYLMAYNNKLYFYARTAAYGWELYSFDGTTATRLTDIAPGPLNGVDGIPSIGNNRIAVYNGMIYFSGSTTGSNHQLYKYDPSTGTASLVSTINPTASARIAYFTPYANKLYFKAEDGSHGAELWTYDGTNAYLAGEVSAGRGTSRVMDLVVYNDKLYFNGLGSLGFELYSFTDASLAVQNMKFTGSVSVMPNPTNGDAALQLSLKSPQTLSVQLTDVTGKLVWQNDAMLFAAGNSYIALPLSAQATGVYFYRVMDNKGSVLAAGKLQKL